MEKYRTLSEVSKETGLSTREIKYYIERRIIKPTKVELPVTCKCRSGKEE